MLSNIIVTAITMGLLAVFIMSNVNQFTEDNTTEDLVQENLSLAEMLTYNKFSKVWQGKMYIDESIGQYVKLPSINLVLDEKRQVIGAFTRWNRRLP